VAPWSRLLSSTYSRPLSVASCSALKLCVVVSALWLLSGFVGGLPALLVCQFIIGAVVRL
jgi:hypothetical protein